jgi:uncharacterized protein with HEPN domain
MCAQPQNATLSMLSKSEFSALVDIRFNIVLITDFVGGLTFDVFKHEFKTLYATTRALEIISEASRRLPADLKGRHPEILWKQMQSAGNRYRHDYDSVEASLIWETAVESLPPLLTIIEAELDAAESDNGRPEGN